MNPYFFFIKNEPGTPCSSHVLHAFHCFLYTEIDFLVQYILTTLSLSLLLPVPPSPLPEIPSPSISLNLQDPEWIEDSRRTQPPEPPKQAHLGSQRPPWQARGLQGSVAGPLHFIAF